MYIYAYIYLCIYTWIYIYICMYTHTYVYMRAFLLFKVNILTWGEGGGEGGR